jgi:hypothetical protein
MHGGGGVEPSISSPHCWVEAHATLGRFAQQSAPCRAKRYSASESPECSWQAKGAARWRCGRATVTPRMFAFSVVAATAGLPRRS